MIYNSPCNNVYTGFIVNFHRTRTGPNFFLVYYKNRSQIVTEPIEVSRVLKSARYLDSSKQLREWCEEMVSKYNRQDPPEPAGSSQEVLDYAKTAGFGPEGHTDTADNDPTANTRMVI